MVVITYNQVTRFARLPSYILKKTFMFPIKDCIGCKCCKFMEREWERIERPKELTLESWTTCTIGQLCSQDQIKSGKFRHRRPRPILDRLLHSPGRHCQYCRKPALRVTVYDKIYSLIHFLSFTFR